MEMLFSGNGSLSNSVGYNIYFRLRAIPTGMYARGYVYGPVCLFLRYTNRTAYNYIQSYIQ